MISKTFDKIKKILPITLLVWPYLCILPFGLGSDNEEFSAVFILLYCGLTLVVYALNIINACLYKGEDACYKLAFWTMLIKLVHIPFYLCVFVIGVCLLLAAVVPALLLVTPIMVFMLFLIDLLLMVTSSLYGMNALIRAARQGMVSKKFAVIGSILHFFFVTDVICSIVVYAKLRKGRKKK